MPSPSIDQLKRAITLQEQIDQLEAELKVVLQGGTPTASPVQTSASVKPARRKKRKMSAAGRANIIAAQKARWIKRKGITAGVVSPLDLLEQPAKKPKRQVSVEGRAKMAAAAKKRWAKVKK